jgi:isopentenyl-diphosphate delta-isomerase
MEQVILVNSKDEELGLSEKMAAHRMKPKLHRAFSVFIFNKKGQMLIHKRISSKPTWGGFWSNTCCSHPRPGEEPAAAASRRLKEELGFTTNLAFLFKFEYSAMCNEEWGEHELDHVFAGFYDGQPKPDLKEIEETKWVDVNQLAKDMKASPQNYTPWFKIAMPRLVEWYRAKRL